jgi:F-type H+-transporting ATPase subunit b
MSTLLHDPTFWTLVAFVIFVVVLFKPLKKALLSGLDSRIETIRSEVEQAQQLREEAQTLLASYQRKQREAQQEANEIVNRAKQDAETHRVEAEKDLKALLERQKELAVEKIAQAEATAVQEVREIAVDLAVAATEKILAEKVTGSLSDSLVDKAVAELPQKLQ